MRGRVAFLELSEEDRVAWRRAYHRRKAKPRRKAQPPKQRSPKQVKLRTCPACKQKKPPRHFMRAATLCLDCRGRRNRKNQALVAKLKRDQPCTDCGRDDIHPCALEFDHLPKHEKLGNISFMMKAGVHPKIFRAELAKCELVCAICHRMRTYFRAGACTRSPT